MLSRRAMIATAALALSAPQVLRAQAIPAELRRIRERGRLVVAALAEDVPPFLMRGADGGVTGRDASLAEALAKALGVALSFERRAASFDALAEMLVRQEADIALSRLSATPRRALRLRFSRPYLVLRQALLLSRPRFARAAAGRDPLEAAREAGAVVAAVADSAYAEYAALMLPQATLRLYPRWQPDVVEAVIAGEVVAGYADELEAQRALGARPDGPLQLRAAILPETRDPIAAAVSWESPALVRWLDLYLENWAPPPSPEELLAPTEADNHR